MLLQILESLPDVRRYGSFLASLTSSRLLRERSEEETLREIGRIVPGEVMPAHLFFGHSYQQALKDCGVIHYFIMRDPRDVVVSEAHYLANMNRWHRLHPPFRHCDTLEDQISLSILGIGKDAEPPYPNVAERYKAFAGWRHNDAVCWLTYEALSSSGCRAEVERIVRFYGISRPDILVDTVSDAAMAAIKPENSHTFRAGGQGGWREVFTNRLKDEMKNVAGDLLIELEYEDDYGW